MCETRRKSGRDVRERTGHLWRGASSKRSPVSCLRSFKTAAGSRVHGSSSGGEERRDGEDPVPVWDPGTPSRESGAVREGDGWHEPWLGKSCSQVHMLDYDDDTGVLDRTSFPHPAGLFYMAENFW